jgi:GT2 family glycosyltransferase
MQLSVIILNYNVSHFLELCVLSVQNATQNSDAEIIVVDNNSSDDSCAMMKKRFPKVKLIENKQNSGFPKGNNIGVAHAKGDYICILNPDTVVAEDTFEKILNTKLWQLNTGIIGCKLIDGTGNFLPESKRGVPTPWVAFTKIFGLYKLFPKSKSFNQYYAQHLHENKTGKVDILVGAFMVMQRQLYNEIGGFDEDCFMYSDDIDLSYRVLLKGKSNYYFHETTVIHYKGESTVKDATYMKHFREFMNFFYQKHFKKSLFFNLMARFGAFYFSFVKFFQGKSRPNAKPMQYILVSENEVLRKQLELQLKKPVKRQDIAQSFSQNLQTEIIFDQNGMDFKTIIHAFETRKSKNSTFKILPKTADFLIGSNSSFDRGEVIVISDFRF